ncbi:amphi-Trp domain-containing protein [Ponticoccus gilvus]|nr:amphi-Trp domain-containing protein [Enemella evansiae]
MSSDKRFSHESLQDAKTIKTLLSALTKGFGKGEMTLSDDDDSLVLQTGELMTVRIKGERAEGRCSVGLRISWADPEAPDRRASGRPKIEDGS